MRYIIYILPEHPISWKKKKPSIIKTALKQLVMTKTIATPLLFQHPNQDSPTNDPSRIYKKTKSSDWTKSLDHLGTLKEPESDPAAQAVLPERTSSEKVPIVKECEAVIVGCGVAGSAAALQLANQGVHVVMLSNQTDPLDCNSYWAQGGIIYKAKDDSVDLLSSDVHRAGAGICEDPAVKKLAREGPSAVESMLLDISHVPFEKTESGELKLTLEASHNRARILYKADHTGKAITESMLSAVQGHKNIELLTAKTVFELETTAEGRCCGIYAISKDSDEIEFYHSNMVLLATGGSGDLYLNTSNPDGARGEGLSIASRAGAALKNLQFVQFHPTTLFIPNERRFLLTEALRGEGAILVDENGRAFAKDYHEHGELAPRDVVARMILSEMDKQSKACMYLDISHKDSAWIKSRFPTIYERCLRHGIDMTQQPMPVVPAAHYHCGGIEVDLNGCTTVPGLYAAGEVSCTGLHGANRLASTSLLEALVWGCTVADHFLQSDASKCSSSSVSSAVGRTFRSAPEVASSEDVDELLLLMRTVMWDCIGPRRTLQGMQEGVARLRQLKAEVRDLVSRCSLTRELVGAQNSIESALAIAEAACKSKVSVGTHYLSDAN